MRIHRALLDLSKLAMASTLLIYSFEIQAVSITGAVLPTSRSVQVGSPATAFATVINATDQTVTGCGLSLGTNINADFEYRTTDPFTNLPIDPAGTTVDIPPGGSQSWVFGITPRGAFAPVEVTIAMDCDNTDPAPVFPSVNTLLLSASNSPVPDMVALAATLSNDGVVRAPGYVGTGVFSVATSNVGAAGNVSAIPELSGNFSGSTALICQTDTATGACMAAPAPSVSFNAAQGGADSFGVFVAAAGNRVDFDPAVTRVRVRFEDSGAIVRGATGVAYETQTQMASNGGTLQFEGTTVQLQTNAAWAPVEVEATIESGPPAPLPNGFGFAERTRNVSVSDPTRLNAPLEMTFDYDNQAIGGDEPVVLHFNETTRAYEPVTYIRLDPANKRVTVDARNFSDFVTTYLAGLLLPDSYAVSSFDVATDVWNIRNFGSYFSPGGNCLGMSAYGVWFTGNRPAEALNGKYSSAGGAPTSQAHMTATRAHLGQSQYWSIQQFRDMNANPDWYIATLMKLALYSTGQPQVLILGTDGKARHADIVYGWNAGGFLVYEVNTSPGEGRSVTVPFSNGSFGSYGPFNDFTYLAMASLGRNEDFAGLTTQAEAGFTDSANINLTSPDEGEEISERKVRLTGSLTGDLTSGGGRDVIAYVNGEPNPVGSDITSFNVEIPVKQGDNTLIVLAGDMSNQSLWYQNAATLVRNFKGIFQAATFRATLTWNKTGDVDLYVTEPAGETSWYRSKATSNGMQLDFDNTSGYGPENTTLSVGEGDTLLAGDYGVRVHYYRGDGPVSGQVQILTYEGEEKQQNRTFNWMIGADGSSATAGPGGTGPQWTDITSVDVTNNIIR